jgi:demethyl-4-deoxygadusol synthase
LTREELNVALQEHKRLCMTYPRSGAGIDAYVGGNQPVAIPLPSLVGGKA